MRGFFSTGIRMEFRLLRRASGVGMGQETCAPRPGNCHNSYRIGNLPLESPLRNSWPRRHKTSHPTEISPFNRSDRPVFRYAGRQYAQQCSRGTFPSLKRRGGCAVNKMSRSYLVPRRRGGAKRKPDRAQPQEKFGEMVRPEDSAGLTTPAAPFKGGFAIFSLMSRPPLLFKGGESSR